MGVTPQRVDDWLNGRKKMNAEQVLQLQQLMRRLAKTTF
jgi:hypothetical protein